MEFDAITRGAASRNLVVLSAVIIIYHLTGATLGEPGAGGTVKLLGGTLSLTCDGLVTLKWCVWVLLGWFLLKYYLHCDWRHDWSAFFEAMWKSRLLQKWARKSFEAPTARYHGQEGPHDAEAIWSFPFLTEGRKTGSYNVRNGMEKRKLVFWTLLESPIMLQYFFPYVMAAVAIGISPWSFSGSC